MVEIGTAAVQNRDYGRLTERLFLAALCFAVAVTMAWIGTIGFSTWWLLERFVL